MGEHEIYTPPIVIVQSDWLGNHGTSRYTVVDTAHCSYYSRAALKSLHACYARTLKCKTLGGATKTNAASIYKSAQAQGQSAVLYCGSCIDF